MRIYYMITSESDVTSGLADTKRFYETRGYFPELVSGVEVEEGETFEQALCRKLGVDSLEPMADKDTGEGWIYFCPNPREFIVVLMNGEQALFNSYWRVSAYFDLKRCEVGWGMFWNPTILRDTGPDYATAYVKAFSRAEALEKGKRQVVRQIKDALEELQTQLKILEFNKEV